MNMKHNETQGNLAASDREDIEENDNQEAALFKQVRCAPSGQKWINDDSSVACACGLLVNKKRVGDHIKACALNPCPLKKISDKKTQVMTVKRIDGNRSVTCHTCSKKVTASQREVSVAKAFARHLNKEHKGMTSRDRLLARRRSFNDSHFLVAKTVAVAVSTGLSLEAEAYKAMKEELKCHGSSYAQATASTADEAREEHLLRNSLRVHPEPQDLFLSSGLYARQMMPSKESMKGLRLVEKMLNISVIDWRQIIAVAEHRRRVRQILNECYSKSADYGFLCGHSLRRFLDFVGGHLAEMEGGLEWKPLVTMLRDLVNSVMKENKGMVAKAHGRREQKHMSEERMDHPTRIRITRTVTKELQKTMEAPLPKEKKALRRKAVWVRQAIYVGMSATQAHRSGVYQQMTIDELNDAIQTPHGIAINHVGGKTRNKHKTVQVPVSKKMLRIMKWYVEQLRPSLNVGGVDNKKLLPQLNVWDAKLLDLKIKELEDIPYPRLLRNNHSRRHHVQLSHTLEEEKRLQGTNISELASLRCHSTATASRYYDARNKAVRATRANEAFITSANKMYGITESESEEIDEESQEMSAAYSRDDDQEQFEKMAVAVGCKELRVVCKKTSTSTASTSNVEQGIASTSSAHDAEESNMNASTASTSNVEQEISSSSNAHAAEESSFAENMNASTASTSNVEQEIS